MNLIYTCDGGFHSDKVPDYWFESFFLKKFIRVRDVLIRHNNTEIDDARICLWKFTYNSAVFRQLDHNLSYP